MSGRGRLTFFPPDDGRQGVGHLEEGASHLFSSRCWRVGGVGRRRGRLTFFPPDDGGLGVSVDVAREGRIVPEIDCCMTRLAREPRSV